MATLPASPAGQSRIDVLVSDLCKRLRVSDVEIRDIVETASLRLLDARVTSFVPVLIERRVREHLRRGADAGGGVVIDLRGRVEARPGLRPETFVQPG